MINFKQLDEHLKAIVGLRFCFFKSKQRITIEMDYNHSNPRYGEPMGSKQMVVYCFEGYGSWHL